MVKKTWKATHYVKTQTSQHRLALRYDVAYEAVGKEVWQDEDKKGTLITMLPNDTIVYIVEPYLRYNCEWHEVKIVRLNSDKLNRKMLSFEQIDDIQQFNKVYCYAEFIDKLSGTPDLLPVKCLNCQQITKSIYDNIIPDWYYHEPIECVLIEECIYYVVIELDYLLTNDEIIKKQKKEAIEKATKYILKFFNKQRDNDIINRLLNSYVFGDIPEEDGWFIDTRPNSKIRFIVRFPAKYVDAIPTDYSKDSDIPNYLSSIPSGWKTTSLNIDRKSVV